ncbi:DUF4062 domain-containing protein [Mesorhizobium sp. M0938]|uniref:DUF4062 domain-containing protein n=1 Tax=unclassified Mesorhizobium TaxID=325217 RepID=UPI0033352C6C
MSNTQKIVRIFIGSPGGLKDERRGAHEVVNSINRSHSDRWGLQLKLLGWEDAVPGFIRPQSKINEDLDKCDYFIGVLWDNWGSRPGPKYTSGFEEEYFRAKERIENGLMKDMAIYFRNVDVPPNMEPGEGLRQVLDFRQKFIDEKTVFFKDFADPQTFKDVVREKLEDIAWHETDILLADDEQLTQPKTAPSIHDKSTEPPTPNSWLLDKEARDFLNDLTQRSPDWDGTSSQEVARLRLIGTAVTRSGNDEDYLGNHDSNLIFRYFRDAALSKQEIRALIDCGVVGFQHQNVPLWRWLAKYEDEDMWSRVNELAAYGEDADKRFAIEILGLGSQPIPSLDEFFTDKRVLKLWLHDKTSDQVFDAAVSFLSSNASSAELTLIEETVALIAPHRRAKIEQAIVSILARTNLNGALKRVVEKEVDVVDLSLLETLFGKPRSLDNGTVVSCLSAKSELVRLRAVKLLFERNEIALEAAQTLLTDSNHEIRLLAAETLKKLGFELSDDVAKQALSIVKPNNRLGLFSTRETDETYYDRYRVNRLLEMDFLALQSKADSRGVLGYRELSALYVGYPKKMKSFIRDNLKEKFNGYLESNIEKGKREGEIGTDTEGELRKLWKFLQKIMCNDALAALCAAGDAHDLELVRGVLGAVEIDATAGILRYLARFGDWSYLSGEGRLAGAWPGSEAALLRRPFERS